MGSNQGKEAIRTIEVDLWNFLPKCAIGAISLRIFKGGLEMFMKEKSVHSS